MLDVEDLCPVCGRPATARFLVIELEFVSLEQIMHDGKDRCFSILGRAGGDYLFGVRGTSRGGFSFGCSLPNEDDSEGKGES